MKIGKNVILTGLENPSSNVKTGPMIQSYIMGDNGCDQCVSQDICYVSRGLKPVKDKFESNRYMEAKGLDLSNRRVRLGAWGDPAFVPKATFDALNLKKYTGYTHFWREDFAQEYRGYLMASVETIEALELAESLGWKCYYNMVDVSLGHISEEEVLERLGSRAISCTFVTKGTQCYDCLLCSDRATKHILIKPHGNKLSMKRLQKTYEKSIEANKILVRNLLSKGA